MYEFYLTRNGTVEREGNTLFFKGDGAKQPIPVLNISDIIITAKVSLSSWALDYLAKLNICVHFLKESGVYMSSLIPSGKNEIGNLTLKQAMLYSDPERRNKVAAEMVNSIKSGILRNLRYYNEKLDLQKEIGRIASYQIGTASIQAIMGVEGNIWSTYYSVFPKIYRGYDQFKREFHPPKDPLNSLISFGNAVLYSTTLSKIMTTGLNPSISFLHEPSDRSFSLALDIADMFKPMIVERIISTLVNNNMTDESCFREEKGGIYLTEKGKKLFLEQYSQKMNTTVKHNNIYISYGGLIRGECIKLIKHIQGEQEYKSIRSWD